MNLDILNELFFFNVAPDIFWPSKIDCKKNEDPIDWMQNEIRKKPAKVVRNGLIIGEANDLDFDNGILDITYYDEPIPVLTDSDWKEWEKDTE